MQSVYIVSTQNQKSESNAFFQVGHTGAKLTKRLVDGAVLPGSGQIFIRDVELKGFALRITPGSKSFILEKRIAGKVKRITLGRYPEITVEQARKEAQKLLGQIATGINPVAEKQKATLTNTTLAQAFEDFCISRKNLKEHTLYDYHRLLESIFAGWKNKPLISINKEMVVKLHAKVGVDRGEAYANLAMRFLRALFNFAIAQYETDEGEAILRDNPVSRLTQTRAWYRVERRQTVIKPHQLAPWYREVEALKNEGTSKQSSSIADYLVLLLLTGLRRQEAARLKWDDIDLAHRTLIIRDTKNRQPLMLPLSTFTFDLLSSRKISASSDYVFPAEGTAGYLIEPRKQIAKVINQSGVDFTLHDLRRTFITVAESIDISAYALKRLVNHKMKNDVTAGYIVSDVERLRAPMQKITDYMLKAMGVIPSAEIIDMKTVNK